MSTVNAALWRGLVRLPTPSHPKKAVMRIEVGTKTTGFELASPSFSIDLNTCLR
jgi:hypothetical protein